jgi:hypothetical protein
MQYELFNQNSFLSRTCKASLAQNSKATNGPTPQEHPSCFMSLENFSASVTKARGDYSARLKSAHRWSDNGFSSLQGKEMKCRPSLPTSPFTARLEKSENGHTFTINGKTQTITLWPTPRVSLVKERTMRTNAGRLFSTGYHANLGEAICLVEYSPLHREMLLEMENQPEYINVEWLEQLMGLPKNWTRMRLKEQRSSATA